MQPPNVEDVLQHFLAPSSALKFLHVALVPLNEVQGAVFATQPTPLKIHPSMNAAQSLSSVAVVLSAQVLSLHAALVAESPKHLTLFPTYPEHSVAVPLY